MDPSHQGDATMVGVVGDSQKSCAGCGTEKTPLWRSGPAGPKSLCNACGIKLRKRTSIMTKADEKRQSQSAANPAASWLPSTFTETLSKCKPKMEKSSLSKCKPKMEKSSLSKFKPKLEKSSSTNLRQSVKVGLAAFGKNMTLLRRQRQRSLRRQRSEEEEAAVLLMSLSCGSVCQSMLR